MLVFILYFTLFNTQLPNLHSIIKVWYRIENICTCDQPGGGLGPVRCKELLICVSVGAIRPDLSGQPHARPDIVDISTYLHSYIFINNRGGFRGAQHQWLELELGISKLLLPLTHYFADPHILDLKYDLLREPVKKKMWKIPHLGGGPARAFSTFKKKMHFKPF